MAAISVNNPRMRKKLKLTLYSNSKALHNVEQLFASDSFGNSQSWRHKKLGADVWADTHCRFCVSQRRTLH